MRSLKMRSHTYPSCGRCVFCDRPFPPEDLTDEHIIPEAIHGALVLRNGSCYGCARKSNADYENAALNLDLELPRVLLGLKGKGKGRLPASIRHLPPVYAADCVDGGEGDRLDFPVEMYPKFFTLVGFQPAGLLVGKDRGGILEGPSLGVFNIGGVGYTNVTVVRKSVNGPFAMTLAKIALCYATAEKNGLFDARGLRALLMGTREDTYNFVVSTEKPERLATNHIHGLYFRERSDYLTVLIDLFASLREDRAECHPYEVVVGRLVA